MSKHMLLARVAIFGAVLLAMAAVSVSHTPAAHAEEPPQCTTVPIETDEADEDALTAHIIVDDTHPMTITGDVTADGCGVGVYVMPHARATISYADIHGAQAFGVYDDNGHATIDHSTVRDITGNGESCGDEGEEEDGGCTGGGNSGGTGGNEEDRGYTGGRHGTGILFVGPRARGTITATTVEGYGRRGISVSGSGAHAVISGNQIIGRGSGSWQNGIWIANGGSASISWNTISNNVTTNGNEASSGIMVAGGSFHNGMPNYTTNVQIEHNYLDNNDTGVLLSNKPVEAGVRTNDHVDDNTVRAGAMGGMNHTGIEDAGGNNDRINDNHIYGYGSRAVVISPDCIHVKEEGNQSYS
jgi:hypothetical protein